MSNLAVSLLDLLLPEPCVLCGAVLSAETRAWRAPVCQDCIGRLYRLADGACERCGMPLLSERLLCIRCRDQVFHFAQARALFAYDGRMRELLHRYKTGRRRRLAGAFAGLLAAELGRSFPGLPVIPVPPRPAFGRGWEHVGEIARQLAGRHGASVSTPLGRTRGSEQKRLDFEARLENVRGAIVLRHGVQGQVVLIDDVLTTCATAEECARVLLSGGARRVHVLALAREL